MYYCVCLFLYQNLHERTVELEESENSLKQVQRQLKESQRNEERSKKEVYEPINTTIIPPQSHTFVQPLSSVN